MNKQTVRYMAHAPRTGPEILEVCGCACVYVKFFLQIWGFNIFLGPIRM